MNHAVVLLFNMLAVVERNQTSTSNAWKTPDAEVWAVLATVRCRVFTSSRKELVDEEKSVLVEELRAAVPLGTDVTEKDRVALVKNRAGVTLFAGPLGIDAVQKFESHLELVLNRNV